MRPIRDFIQTEPRENVPATETTEVWIAFDRDNVYVSFRCGESEPSRMVLNEMRRDSFNLLQNEGVGFMFDTFYDKRNSVVFNVTPLGGRVDGQVTNERQYNGDWNPIWDVAVLPIDTGWTAEFALPFKSLRYRPGHRAVLGLQRPAHQSLEERDVLRRAHPQLGRATRPLRRLHGGDARRHRSAVRIAQPRDQAVCDRAT